MTFPRPQQQQSPLSLFLLFSLAVHVLGLGVFTVISPKFIEEKRTQISIQIGGMKASPAPAPSKVKNIPIQTPKPATPKVATPTPVPVQQPKSITPKVATPTPVPVQQPKSITPKVVTTPPQPRPVAPKVVTPPVQQAKPITPKVVTPPVQQAKPVTPKVVTPNPVQQAKPVTPKVVTPPVQQVKPVAPKVPVVDKTQEMSDKLDDVLNKKTQKKSTADALADANWSGTPRNTISFPNLTASIPQQYKSRGYGFSITAKITFSPQGWVSGVELLRASGDPRIDGIFRTELRKIRIEPSKKTSYDTITKTFTISVK